MALKKTIAGYLKTYEVDVFDAGGAFSHREVHSTWIDEKHVDMHPFEEAAILKHWEFGKAQLAVPAKPGLDEEHEWMIAHGVDYIKQKRDEWQKAYDEAQPALKALQEEHLALHDKWCKHVDFCLTNSLEPDTYQGE